VDEDRGRDHRVHAAPQGACRAVRDGPGPIGMASI
jgi:hypothetical protein